jgi:hypothetical protein
MGTAACAVTAEPSGSEVEARWRRGGGVRERSERTMGTAACAVTAEPSGSEVEA